MRFVKEETIIREARKKGKNVEALSNRSMKRDTAARRAEEHGGFVVVERDGGFLPCVMKEYPDGRHT